MRFFFFISILFILNACDSGQTRFDSEEDMHTYLNSPENGFIAAEEMNDLKIEAKLIPPLNDDPKKYCAIQVRLYRKDGLSVLDFKSAGEQERLAREGYLSFDVVNDVYLQSGETIISPAFHHYERNYGLKPSVDILFEFPTRQIKEDVTFCYRDEIFGQGLVRIPFDKDLFNTCYVTKK